MLLKGVLSKDSTKEIEVSVDEKGSVADLRVQVAVSIESVLMTLESE